MNQEISLYDRIGGNDSIKALIDQLYKRVLSDDELAPFFKDSEVDRVIKMQYEFFAAALGGPVEYTGVELGRSHYGRGITRHHFAKYVNHLIDTLSDLDIDQNDADSIIARINLYTDDIVGGAGIDG